MGSSPISSTYIWDSIWLSHFGVFGCILVHFFAFGKGWLCSPLGLG